MQLDIKDEAGEVGYASTVAAGDDDRRGAPATTTPRQAIDELHALGVRVIGRIVCFLDPTCRRVGVGERAPRDARARRGRHRAAGQRLRHGGVHQRRPTPRSASTRSTSPSKPPALGFDEILYDYVRRPEGDIGGDAVPGLADRARRRRSPASSPTPTPARRHGRAARRLGVRHRRHPAGADRRRTSPARPARRLRPRWRRCRTPRCRASSAGLERGLRVGDEAGDRHVGRHVETRELHRRDVALGPADVVVEDLVEAQADGLGGQVDLVLAHLRVGEVA